MLATAIVIVVEVPIFRSTKLAEYTPDIAMGSKWLLLVIFIGIHFFCWALIAAATRLLVKKFS